MTAPRAFGPGELDGAEGLRVDDVAAETRIARDLEAMTSQAAALPSPDFTDRVMLAIDLEPVPAPAHAAAVALRRGAIGAFLASFSDAWRVATRSGFPTAVRAQALALVLVVGALAAGSGVAAAGAVGLIRDDRGCHRRLPRSRRPRPSCRAPARRWPRRPSSRRRPSLRPSRRPTSPRPRSRRAPCARPTPATTTAVGAVEAAGAVAAVAAGTARTAPTTTVASGPRGRPATPVVAARTRPTTAVAAAAAAAAAAVATTRPVPAGPARTTAASDARVDLTRRTG